MRNRRSDNEIAPVTMQTHSETPRRTVTKHGTATTMNTANIGRKPESNGHPKNAKAVVDDS